MSKSKLSVLAAALSEKSGLSMEDAEKFIKQMFDVANDALQQDKIVKMKWLGTFKVQSVKDRESIDVNTGERILIEGRDKISFTPDAVLKEIVNKPFAQFETVVVNDGVDFSAIDEKFAKMEAEDKSIVLQENDSSIQKQVTAFAQAPDDSSAKETTSSVNETESLSANNKNEETATDEETSSGINATSGINASSEVLVFGDDEIVPLHPCITDDVVVISDQNGVITISSDSTSSPKEKEEAADVIVVGGVSSDEVDKMEVSHAEEKEESVNQSQMAEGRNGDSVIVYPHRGETEKTNEIKTSEEVDNSGKQDVSEEKEEVSEEAKNVLGKPKNEVETAKSEADTETAKSKAGTATSEAKAEMSDANVAKLEADAEKTSESTKSESSKSAESSKSDNSNSSAESNELNEAVESSEVTKTGEAEETGEVMKTGEAEETEETDNQASRHFIVPKYMVAIASVVFVALVGGGCWFAFNYGKKSVLNDAFALQADKPKTMPTAKAIASKTVDNQDSTQLILQQKAKQDSIRLSEANKAIKLAEEAEILKEQSKNKNASNELTEGTSKGTFSETAAVQKQKEKQQAERTNVATEKVAAEKTKAAAEKAAAERAAAKAKAEKALADKLKADKAKVAKAAKDAKSAKSAEVTKPSKYDSDPRVRTGAYRIVGVAQTVTVKPGQTLAGISKSYLGSGMECYVEAINGGAEVKAGQKIKIPKLELKKKVASQQVKQ